MEVDGIACIAMFKAICADTYSRYMKWFDDHPEETWCYWSKDEPIRPADRDNEELLAKHPEIEDIDDHTVVRRERDVLVFSKFCPRMRKSLAAMLGTDSDCVFVRDGLCVTVSRDWSESNFRVLVRPQ